MNDGIYNDLKKNLHFWFQWSLNAASISWLNNWCFHSASWCMASAAGGRYPSIHPSYPLQGCRRMEPIPADIGTPWTGLEGAHTAMAPGMDSNPEPTARINGSSSEISETSDHSDSFSHFNLHPVLSVLWVCVHCVFVDSCADDEGLHVFCICVLTEFYSEVKCWLCVVLEWLFENMSIIRINKHSLDTDWSFPALCFIMTIKAFYSILFIKCSLLTTRGNQSVCIINTSFLAFIKAVTFKKKAFY